MDAQMETLDEFFDLINFSSGPIDHCHDPQIDFSVANLALQLQNDMFWNAPNAPDNQTVENQFVGDHTHQEQVDLLLSRPPIRSKPRRQRLSKSQKTCLNSWLLA